MATEAQIAANRRNALLSTGPKTKHGKERIRFNAVRHGLYADQLVALGENDAEFGAYTTALRASFSPQDAFEELLVGQLALIGWRTERLATMEAALLDAAARWAHRRRDFVGKPPLDVWPEQLTPLSRHEAMLHRAFQRTALMLERHRAGRGAAPKPAPAAIRNFAEQSQLSEAVQGAEPESEADGKANISVIPGLASTVSEHPFVVPAEAGIQGSGTSLTLDSRLRGNDG